MWLAVVVSAAALTVGTSVYVFAREGADCARTPQHHPPDSVGVSPLHIRKYLASQYATRVRFVVPHHDGPDAIEMSVSDAAGTFLHGKVRAIRAERGSGWLIATTNTCGD